MMTIPFKFCAITAVHFRWQKTRHAWRQFAADILGFILHMLRKTVFIRGTIVTERDKRLVDADPLTLQRSSR